MRNRHIVSSGLGFGGGLTVFIQLGLFVSSGLGFGGGLTVFIQLGLFFFFFGCVAGFPASNSDGKCHVFSVAHM